MVKNVSSLTRNGVRDFLLQRVSAVYMTVFLLGFVIYFFLKPFDFYSWHAMFENNFMRVAALLFFLSLMIHTWIGMWTIATDYLHNIFIRSGFLIVLMLILLASFIWSIVILWSL